jgi:hypothetical protein
LVFATVLLALSFFITGIGLYFFKRQPKSGRYKKISIVIFVLAIIIVGIAVAAVAQNSGSNSTSTKSTSSNSNPMSTEITQVQVVVQYNETIAGNQWQGAIDDGVSDYSISGYGNNATTINRPSQYMNIPWIVSANAQKVTDSLEQMDTTSDTITVTIQTMDGTVLQTASTSTLYGVASVTVTIPA